MVSFKQWFSNDLVERSVEEQAPLVKEWFEGPCGSLLVASEKALIDETLPRLFGYHIMQISIHQDVELMDASPIHHRFRVLSSSAIEERKEKVGQHDYLSSNFDSLPFESDSVDVVILHHVLEFSPNPHQVLKEVNRVLIPRGHVIIVGFNPFSLLGLWKSVASLVSGQQHWRYNSITKWRLQDWFKLIDLKKIQVMDTFYRIPFKSHLLLNRFAFLEKLGKSLRLPTGGSYVMTARKDVNAVTPIRAPWERSSRHLSGLAAARPTAPRSAASNAAKNYPSHKNKRWLH